MLWVISMLAVKIYIAVVNHIVRKFGKFGELPMIYQTKTIKIGTYN